ncbi:L-lactate permease [Brevinematales bacterium NS]|nr:L-lactate permease [Brevinematales bacterium NS]
MEFSFWTKVVFACVPFVLLFAGILGTKLKTYVVTLFVLFVTTVLAIIGWQASWSLIGFSYLEGTIIAILPILWVILMAVFTYEVGVRTQSMEKIQNFLEKISPEKAIQAILIAFGFGGFLESVAGFGTAVAIPTAMLVSIGFQPIKAIVISLVANSVPVAFGALGIPVIVLSRITDLPLSGLTPAIAWQLFPFSFLIPVVIAILSSDEKKLPFHVWGEALLFGAVFTLIQTTVALFVGPELVAVLASLGVLITGVLLRWKEVKKELPSLAKPMAPYGFLLVLVLLTRLVPLPQIRSFPFVISWSSEGHSITIEWLTTPGTLLLIATLFGGIIQGVSGKKLWEAFLSSLVKLKSSMLTILSIVIMAKVMGNTPMVSDLSKALAVLSGPLFPFVSPLLGALGTFVTGSDTSSNILFGKLQRDTAKSLSLDPTWLAAANTSGATAGKMISPQSISVATSATGLQGSEGKILSRSLWFCLGYVGLLGGLVSVVAFL